MNPSSYSIICIIIPEFFRWGASCGFREKDSWDEFHRRENHPLLASSDCWEMSETLQSIWVSHCVQFISFSWLSSIIHIICEVFTCYGRTLMHATKFCGECREIKQPWLGIRGRSLHLMESARLEEICHNFPKPPSGVFVDMVLIHPPTHQPMVPHPGHFFLTISLLINCNYFCWDT